MQCLTCGHLLCYSHSVRSFCLVLLPLELTARAVQTHVLLSTWKAPHLIPSHSQFQAIAIPLLKKWMWALKIVPIHDLGLLFFFFEYHPVLFAHKYQLPKQRPSRQTALQLSSHPRVMENHRLSLMQLSSYTASADRKSVV